MIEADYDPDEFIDVALNCIFPSTEEIDPEILKEITNFLETSETKNYPEDAEIVRGEIRKALIHFKNRPYLYQTRKKMEEILRNDENWRKFFIAPKLLMEEMKNAGLNKEEIEMLKESLKTAEKSYYRMKSIPSP